MTLSKHLHPFKIFLYTLCLATHFQPIDSSNQCSITFQTWHRSEYSNTICTSEITVELLQVWLNFTKSQVFEKKDNEYDVDEKSLFFYGDDSTPILDENVQIQFLKKATANSNTCNIYVDAVIQPTQKNLNIAKQKGHTSIAQVLKQMIDYQASSQIDKIENDIQEKEKQIQDIENKTKIYNEDSPNNPLKRLHDFEKGTFNWGIKEILGSLTDYKDLLNPENSFTNLQQKVRTRTRELSLVKYKSLSSKPLLKKETIEKLIEEERKKMNDCEKEKEQLPSLKEEKKQLERNKSSALNNIKNKTKDLRSKLIQQQANLYTQQKNNTSSSQPNNPPAPVVPRIQPRINPLNPNLSDMNRRQLSPTFQQMILDSVKQQNQSNQTPQTQNQSRQPRPFTQPQSQRLDLNNPLLIEQQQNTQSSNNTPPNINKPSTNTDQPQPDLGSDTDSTDNSNKKWYWIGGVSLVGIVGYFLLFSGKENKKPKEEEDLL